jgi:hypothetical protein
LKKNPLGEKKQGKRTQDGAHGLPQGQAQGLPRLEEMPLPKKDQAKAPIVEKSSEKKKKKKKKKKRLKAAVGMRLVRSPVIILESDVVKEANVPSS